MKVFFKVFNIFFTLICALICIASIILKILAIYSGLKILQPFTLALCYVSFGVSAASMTLNFFAYSVFDKNKLLLPSIVFFALSTVFFIISFFI